MTRRYYTITRPKAYDDMGEWQWAESGNPPACTVFEPEEQHVFSGILDHEGKPLYRAAMEPIGFKLTKEPA